MLYVRSTTGVLVPLNSVAKLSFGVGPLSVTHLGQLPSVTLSFDLRPGLSLSDAITVVDKAVLELQVPATLTGSYQGTAQAFQSSLAGMGVLLMFAIFVIYLVLGMLYESFIHPITILSGLPTAGLGALLTLWAFGLELNMYGFVGIIMLIGIVKKNAIMMIDFAIERAAQRGQGREGGDPRGLHHPFPPDHDDDLRGPDGHAADRPGHRRRRRMRASRSAWRSSGGWCCRSSSRCTSRR